MSSSVLHHTVLICKWIMCLIWNVKTHHVTSWGIITASSSLPQRSKHSIYSACFSLFTSCVCAVSVILRHLPPTLSSTGDTVDLVDSTVVPGLNASQTQWFSLRIMSALVSSSHYPTPHIFRLAGDYQVFTLQVSWVFPVCSLQYVCKAGTMNEWMDDR